MTSEAETALLMVITCQSLHEDSACYSGHHFEESSIHFFFFCQSTNFVQFLPSWIRWWLYWATQKGDANLMLTKIWISDCFSEILWWKWNLGLFINWMIWGFRPNSGTMPPTSHKIWKTLFFLFITYFFCFCKTFEQFCLKIRISRCLWIPCAMPNMWINVFFFFLLLNYIYHLHTFWFSYLLSSSSALHLLYLWCLQLY